MANRLLHTYPIFQPKYRTYKPIGVCSTYTFTAVVFFSKKGFFGQYSERYCQRLGTLARTEPLTLRPWRQLLSITLPLFYRRPNWILIKRINKYIWQICDFLQNQWWLFFEKKYHPLFFERSLLGASPTIRLCEKAWHIQ